MGTGQNCTKGNFCKNILFHEDKLAQEDKISQGKKNNEDIFEPRVNFARVATLHGGSFLHENKKTEKVTSR